MNSVCHISCCLNHDKTPGITYHKFPKIVAELWFSVNNIPIRKTGNTSEIIVCSDHFKSEDYIYTDSGIKLKSGSIPSLYLKIPKKDVTETSLSEIVVHSSSSVQNQYLVSSVLPFRPDEMLKTFVETYPEKEKNLEVIMFHKNMDSPLLNQFIDDNVQFIDIITISDETDTLTAINSMHNYSIPIETNTKSSTEPSQVEQSEPNINKLLKGKVLLRTVMKTSPLKNGKKLKNKKGCIDLSKKDPKRPRRSIIKVTKKMRNDETTENVSLDHDYTSPVEDIKLENIDESLVDKDTYKIMCSENYVWRLRKKINLYSKKTRFLRRRVDALKTIVSYLKHRI